MEHEVEGPRPRGRPKKTWKEVVREDCQARKLNKEDAMDLCKWRKMIKDARWSGWVWVGECSFWYWPTRVVPDQRPLNGRCCCCWCKRWCGFGWQWHWLDHVQKASPCFRQLIVPTPHYSICMGQMFSWCPTNSVKALKAISNHWRQFI